MSSKVTLMKTLAYVESLRFYHHHHHHHKPSNKLGQAQVLLVGAVYNVNFFLLPETL